MAAVLDGLLYGGLGVLAAAAFAFTWIHARRAWVMGRTAAVVAWIALIPFTVLLAWTLGLAAVGIAAAAVSVVPNSMTPAMWAVTLMIFADLVAIGVLRRTERTHIRRGNSGRARAVDSGRGSHGDHALDRESRDHRAADWDLGVTASRSGELSRKPR